MLFCSSKLKLRRQKQTEGRGDGGTEGRGDGAVWSPLSQPSRRLHRDSEEVGLHPAAPVFSTRPPPLIKSVSSQPLECFQDTFVWEETQQRMNY